MIEAHDRHRVSPEGKALGEQMARLHDVLPELAALTKDVPLSPPDSQRHIVDAAEAKRERRAEKRRQIAALAATRRAT